MGKQTPCTASAQQVEDGVQDFAQGMDATPTSWRLPFGKKRFDQLPLGIGEVGRIGFSLVVFVHDEKYTPKATIKQIFQTLSHR